MPKKSVAQSRCRTGYKQRGDCLNPIEGIADGRRAIGRPLKSKIDQYESSPILCEER